MCLGGPNGERFIKKGTTKMSHYKKYRYTLIEKYLSSMMEEISIEVVKEEFENKLSFFRENPPQDDTVICAISRDILEIAEKKVSESFRDMFYTTIIQDTTPNKRNFKNILDNMLYDLTHNISLMNGLRI